jgi:hypothetical protein
MFGFAPGTCGWRSGEDAAEAERRQAQFARAARPESQRRQAEAAAEDDSPWCRICGNGLCQCKRRCSMCWCLAVVNVGLGLTLLASPWGKSMGRS